MRLTTFRPTRTQYWTSIAMDKAQKNPLIESLGPYRELGEWPGLLEHNPLDEFPEAPTEADRHDFLDGIDDRFAVTKTALRLASDIQSMIRAGYRERNPLRPECRRKLYKVADLDGRFDISAPTFYSNSHCLIVSAITGMGKSLSVHRILSTLNQVIVHTQNREAGWLKHTQIVHLTVKMSETGSRGSFINAVLYALDSLLGTDYYNGLKAERNVGNRTVRVAQLLALHSVGLLVVEEMQAENFMESRFKKELNVFFLSILSFGVPLLLIGNPRAFERLSEHKQTERRYYSYDPITLWPYDSATDRDWRDAIAPALWGYQVVDAADDDSDVVAKALWKYSGGVPGYAKQLIVESQRSILRREEKRLSVDALERHFNNLASFRRFRPLITGLTTRNAALIAEGIDIPVEQFEQRWKAQGAAKSEPTKSSAPPETPNVGDWSDYAGRKKKAAKSSSTRMKNKRSRAKTMQAGLDDDDIRRTNKLQDSLAKTMDELEADDEPPEA